MYVSLVRRDVRRGVQICIGWDIFQYSGLLLLSSKIHFRSLYLYSLHSPASSFYPFLN